MDLQRVLKEEHEKISKDAKRRKSEASYIIGLIESDSDRYREIFVDNSVPEDEIPNELYRAVRKTIIDLDEEAVRVIGMPPRVHSDSEYQEALKTPVVRLGWADYFKREEKRLPNVRTYGLTEKGLEIVGNYREAHGLISIEESRKKTYEFFFGENVA